MSEILNVYAREILDSRGNPTIEVEVMTENGFMGRAAVPSGASTGTHEAVELRDEDKKWYLGKGVLNAISNVRKGMSHMIAYHQQHGIDRMMIDLDVTPQQDKLGENAILGVSLAVANAAAQEASQPICLYLGGVNSQPLLNTINFMYKMLFESSIVVDSRSLLPRPFT
jgi:enolase